MLSENRIRLLLTTCVSEKEVESLFKELGVTNLQDKINFLTEPGVRYFDLSGKPKIRYLQLLNNYVINQSSRIKDPISKYLPF